MPIWAPKTRWAQWAIKQEKQRLAERKLRPETALPELEVQAQEVEPFQPARPKAPIETEAWQPRPQPLRPQPELPAELPAISREIAPTPWYTTVAQKVSAPLEWIQEKLEKPWAATITAPLSPKLPYKTGETWLKHEKREYEAWKAPKFVKGVSEFLMPLWWLPYFGWAAKGAGLIPKIGGTIAKGILGTERAMAYPIAKPLQLIGKGVTKIVKLPTFEQLREKVFKTGRFRALAERLSPLPGMKTAMGIANPSAVAKGLAQEGRVVYGGMREIADNAVNAIMPQLERHGNIRKMFGLDDLGRSIAVKPKVKGASIEWHDIFAKPNAYILDDAQKGYIKDFHSLLDNVIQYAEKEIGVKIPKIELLDEMRYVPRVWEGKEGLYNMATGEWRAIGTVNEPEKWVKIATPLRGPRVPEVIGAKPFFTRPRFYELAEDALQKGLYPGPWGPNETMNIYLKGLYRMMVDKMTADYLKPLGKTIKELTPLAVRQTVADAAVKYRGLSNLEKVIHRAGRGEKLPAQTLKVAEMARPGISSELTAENLNKVIGIATKEYTRPAFSYQRTLKSGVKKTYNVPQKVIKRGQPIKRADELVTEVIASRKTAWAEYQTARRARAVAYEYARRKPGWRAIGHPFAAGRMFPEEIANDLNQMLRDRAMPIFTKLSNVNALSRFMVTGFDFGAGLIQGVPLLMTNPVKWGKSMGLSIGAFFDLGVRARYLSRPENIKVLERLIPEGLLIGNSEYMEAAAGGLLRSRPVQVIDKLNAIQRFATSFNTFGDIARIEWAKALLPMVEREGKSLKELAAFLNEATGVLSSRALGVGATQREIEGAILLFAPRYFRANMALWSDMAKGGLRGTLARDTLVSMTMGGFFWYYGACKALGQEPNFDPSSGKFMTVQIGNQHIGLGSMQVAMVRLLGNIYQTATEDPKGFIKLNSRDNPLVQFFRSRIAPITGVGWDIVTGRTFIGEPLDEPADWAENILANRLLPFWLSGFITDYPKPGWAQVPGEIFGARTWPLQLWEKRDELRERLAKAEFNKPRYSTKTETGLNTYQKRELEDKYSDLKSITEEATAQRLERGGVEDELWHSFQSEREAGRERRLTRFTAIQQGYDKGEYTGYEARNLIKKANSDLRAIYKHIELNPQYQDILEYFNRPLTMEDIRDTPIEDIAYDEYMSLMYSDELENEAGEYDFDRAETIKQVFIAQWGYEMLNYIQQKMQQAQKEFPSIVQEYYKSIDIMRPYWQVQDWANKTYGEPVTQRQETMLNRIVSKIRHNLRLQNPDIENYYQMFYVRT